MTKLFFEPSVNEVTVNSIIRVDTDLEIHKVEELSDWDIDVVDNFENTYYVIPKKKRKRQRTIAELQMLQSLPYEVKVEKSKLRIIEAYDFFEGNMNVSYSGGKDSEVLLHLVRSIYPNIKGVFSNTGLEYPEIVEHVKTHDNIEIIRPEIPFNKVIKDIGYPVASKKTARMLRDLQNPTATNENSRRLYLTGVKMDGTKTKSFKLAQRWKPLIDSKWKISEKCCDIMKKNPIKNYNKDRHEYSYVGTMAQESTQRRVSWLNTGCNAFEGNKKKSMPLSFWTEQDILRYIVENNLKIADVYGDIVQEGGKYCLNGVKRTGCMFCMFGVQLEKEPNRFQMMESTHPKQYDYCINKLGMGELMDFCNIPYKNKSK